MFRWGVMSTAKIGREQVVPAIVKAQNGVLAAVASRDLAKAEAMAARFGAPHAFGSYEAMLGSEAVDGVYIPLITSEHVRWALESVKAGKHVLVEKPLAMHADEIVPLVEAASGTGLIVSEAFMVTYHPQWHKVKALVAEGAIGRLRMVQGAFSYNNAADPGNMRNHKSQGGGALPDIGVYPTVTTRFVTGKEPQRVSASVEYGGNDVDVFSSIRQDYGTFELSFYCSMRLGLRQVMVFHGDEGFIEVRAPFNAGGYGLAEVALVNQSRDHEQLFRFAGVDQYQLMVEAFADAAAGGDRAANFGLDQSILNQTAIDAVFRAGHRADGSWEPVAT